MKSKRNNFQKSIVFGHIIECFDNTLYGFFSYILAPVFFPTYSKEASLLAAYGAFFAGFVARPFGAIVFGYFGDKYGRKKPLILSMFLISIPTLIIGLLPSYQSLGLCAPIILITCRLVQGFLMGGEFSGANLYIIEMSNKQSIGLNTGKLICSGILGAILATVIGALVTLPNLPFWFWRIPFVFGGIAALTTFFSRKNLVETVDFEKFKKDRVDRKISFLTLIQNFKKEILVSTFISGLTVVPLYSATILGNKIFNSLGYSVSSSMILNTIGMVADAFFVVLCGYVADRIGFYKNLLLGSVALIIILPFSFWLISGSSITTLNVILFILLLVGTGCIVNGCGMPYISTYFPIECRYLGAALSISLGHAFLGGTTPWIGSLLIDIFNSNYAPMFWILFVCVTTLCLLIKVKHPIYNKKHH